MALYDRLDIALDTIPFNSGTTAFDALWMGVPIVTLEGNWTGGRLVSAFPKGIRSPGLDCPNRAGVCLPSLFAGWRSGRPQASAQNPTFAHGSSPLCDAKDITRSLENALEAMYDARMAGAQTGPSPIIRDE